MIKVHLTIRGNKHYLTNFEVILSFRLFKYLLVIFNTSNDTRVLSNTNNHPSHYSWSTVDTPHPPARTRNNHEGGNKTGRRPTFHQEQSGKYLLPKKQGQNKSKLIRIAKKATVE